MSDINNKPTRYREGYRPEGGMPGGGRSSIHYEIKGNRVVGPLIGCPLMLFMIVFVLFLTIIAFILSIFGGRKSAEFIMRRASQMRNPGRGSSFGGTDSDVIDVEGEVIDPPRRDNE